jgi:hypothetical protein
MTSHYDLTDKKAFFKEFMFCVREMRKHQIKFFKSRSIDAKNQAIKYERRIDEMLEAIDMSQKQTLPL